MKRKAEVIGIAPSPVTPEEGRLNRLMIDIAVDTLKAHIRALRRAKARQRRAEKRRRQLRLVVPAPMWALTAAQVRFERASGWPGGRPGYVSYLANPNSVPSRVACCC